MQHAITAKGATNVLRNILKFEPNVSNSLTKTLLATSLRRDNSNTLVKTHVPVLRCHMSYTSLSHADFSELAPEYAPTKVINGRYVSNLLHTNDYFLIFKSIDELQQYFKYSQGTKINELDVRLKEINDFAHYMRFLYPNFMPDLDDLGDLLTIARRSAIIDNKVKAKDFRTSLKLLLEKRTEAYSRYDLSAATQLSEYSLLLSDFITKKYGSFTLRFPQISRSNCVVLHNFPARIRLEKLTEFLWDLNWYDKSTLRIRKIFVNRSTNLATLILCFNTSEDANHCVRRLHNQNLFYNKKLPVLSAEIL